MPLVNAKCTNCGSNLEVDNTKDAAICQYCGMPYVVEKAINNFNVTNNIQANVVNVFGGNSADFVIRAGTLEKYNGAATEVVIPNSVTKIGDRAFSGCTGLTSVTIPNSVTKISSSAFSGCSSLTSVTIPYSVTEIGSSTFSGCSGLTIVTIPDSVTEIDYRAFYGCSSLTSVTIPNSVTKIGDGAFSHCSSLTSVTIPNSMTIIDLHAFDGTPWNEKRRAYGLSTVSPSTMSNCYIATAVYGSYDCPQVWTLRRFRDYTLARTWYGRAFIRCYYATSPALVKWFGKTRWFRAIWKRRLDALVSRLKKEGFEDTPYRDKM
ncbi:MAG: leucine-rich repeat domain-containing protein [Clostridia bacterium]|nr:leucine-rich repeat domain-containing protein [Clostridia bacterium]